MTGPSRTVRRLLVVLPTWVGDAVMATPAVRLLRTRLAGALIGGLVRPGIDEVLEGSGLLDDVHVRREQGVMGHKHAAARVRALRYDAALILANSFSTALICRLAGIPRRAGYDRDGRGLLLTDRFPPPRRPGGRFAVIPALTYYWRAARALLGDIGLAELAEPTLELPAGALMELGQSEAQERESAEVLARLGIDPGAPRAILCPGGNRPEKRWPADRFAALGDVLAREHGLAVIVAGSPAERPLVASIVASMRAPGADLAAAGASLGALKGIVRGSRLMVTNDTGPRHVAAALRVPLVTIFGPTDHRWTLVPAPAGQRSILADPSLTADDIADEHPDRCRIDRIDVERVVAAAAGLLGEAGGVL